MCHCLKRAFFALLGRPGPTRFPMGTFLAPKRASVFFSKSAMAIMCAHIYCLRNFEQVQKDFKKLSFIKIFLVLLIFLRSLRLLTSLTGLLVVFSNFCICSWWLVSESGQKYPIIRPFSFLFTIFILIKIFILQLYRHLWILVTGRLFHCNLRIFDSKIWFSKMKGSVMLRNVLMSAPFQRVIK